MAKKAAAEKPPKPAKAAKAAKKTGPGFFLEKGEKLILGVGVALTGLLLLYGVMTLSDTADPAKMIAELKTNADRVNREVNKTEGGEIAPLPQWVTTPAGLKTVSASEFPLAGPPFEPVHQPTMLRENPRVLTPIAAQIDALRFPMRSLDISLTGDGEPMIGVLTTGPKKDSNPDSFRNALRTVAGRLRQAKPKPRPGAPGTPGNAPRAFPQGTPGFPPNLANVRGGFPPGGGFPPPGGMLNLGEGDPGGGMNPFGGQRDDRAVSYKTPEEIGKNSYTLAETVYPLQAVMVQAVFPMTAQIEEIKRALRLRTAQEAMSAAQDAGAAPPRQGMMLGANQPPRGEDDAGLRGQPGTNPALSVGIQFAGFEVQRRQITPSGEDLGWAPFDHVDAYFKTIYSRYVGYDPDPPYLTPFLRYDQMMAEPLPQLAEGLGQYPALRLPPIVNAINKMIADAVVVPTPSAFEMRFKNAAGGNPFIPLGQGQLGAAFGQAPPPPPPVQPGFPGATPGQTGRPGDPTGGAFALPPVDYTLIRFLDPTVKTGESYEYQIRVKMKNPNFGKDKDVQAKSDAAVEILYGPWWQAGNVTAEKEYDPKASMVTIPPDGFMYAIETGKYLEKADELVKEVGRKPTEQAPMKALLETREMSDGRRAAVQFQQWLPQVRATGDKNEPVGTWVVADMPVAPGEFVGKRQLIKLPLWSAASGPSGQYVLRDLAGGVKVAKIEDKNQPKGWPVKFRPKPSILLIDFDGGQVKGKSGGRDIQEEAATELLLLQPDGKLVVKSSTDDMADPKRVEREKTWTEWIDRVKTRPHNPGPGMNPDGMTPGAAGGRDAS